MDRLSVVVLAAVLVAGVLAGCAPSGEGQSQASSASAAASASSAEAASASAQASKNPDAQPVAASGDASVASSDVAASSDAAASSDSASSDKGSSDPVLSGPSGISETNVAMNYLSVDQVQAAVEGGKKGFVVVDVRKPEDAAKGHIIGAIFAPMNKAVDNNNYAPAILNITSALTEATGNEVGEGAEVVLACYKGKKYAQAATDILNALGADMQHVYTMEGGMEAWDAAGKPTVADAAAE